MIAVENLSFRYPGATATALRDVSFQVAEGEVFGLLGPSGAGKSTLQRVLTRQNRRYDGKVAVLGRDLQAWGQEFYERVGVGFELPNHYLRLTGRENLAFFAALYQSATRPVEELLAAVGLADAADQHVSQYSKGMRMRLNFVRAILHDPELVFLDEPTSGLDPVNAGILKDLIRRLRARGRTVVLTTHNMRDVEELCDRVAFIVGGELKLIDRPRNLMLQHGERKLRVEYGADAHQDFPLDGLADNAAFQHLLRTEAIRTIHTREASLDQVFARVTGVALRQDAA